MFDELLTHCMQLVNLPYTILVVIKLVYWSTVILGVLDFHSVDADLHADGDVDVHADGDAGHGDGDAGHDGDGGHDVMSGFFKIIGVGEIPVMILASIAVLTMWSASLLANYYWNPSGALWFGAVIFVPILILGIGLARVVTLPLRPIFRVVENEDGAHDEQLIGKACVIRSESATLQYGQAEVASNGAPNLVNVRTRKETPLERGAEAVIVDYDAESNVYVVAGIDWEAE